MLSKIVNSVCIFCLLLASPLFADQRLGMVDELDQEVGRRIELFLKNRASLPATLTGAVQLLAHDQISTLYQQRAFQPVWLDGAGLKPEAMILMQSLRDAGSQGLCSDEYLLTELEGLIRIQSDFSRHNLTLAPDNRALLDLFLSQAFLTYATHLVEGQVDPSLAHVDWSARRRKADLVKLLGYAIERHRLPQVLEGLTPAHAGYQRLITVLDRYKQISAAGGWPTIPPGPTLKPGDNDDRVLLLRKLLLLTGDLVGITTQEPSYDQTTQAALSNFQARHGLVADGVIGASTLSALNVLVEKRIRQIELNLERWRWMPKSFGDRYIRVNVADFSLEVIEGDELVLQMPVIVGTQYRKTPVFSARMTYLEFAPYWTVPATILREDKLPKIKRNPDYLTENHFQILATDDVESVVDPKEIDWSRMSAGRFPGMLRMDPGPWNPLGRVKFIFPNKYNVYLHDTNEVSLFGENVRSFSSGCIRVKRPEELASYLLEKDLGKDRLRELLAATTPQQVPIDPLPVHIQYWTAWVDRQGQVNFRPDVYYRDLDLDVALTEPSYRVMNQLEVSIGAHLANY